MATRKRSQDDKTQRMRSTSTQKVDYLKLANGKLNDFIQDFQEEKKPARQRSRSQKKRGRKPKVIEVKEKIRKTPSIKPPRIARSKSLKPIKRVPPRKKILSPDNQVSLLLKWRNEKQPLKSATPNDKTNKVVSMKNILKQDLSKHGQNLQALFINILWQERNKKCKKDGYKITDLIDLKLPLSLMKNGIVFIWSEKEILSQILDIMESKGFTYIENFSIMFLSLDKCVSSIKNSEEDSLNSSESTNNSKTNGISSDITLKDSQKLSDSQIDISNESDQTNNKNQSSNENLQQKDKKSLNLQKQFKEDEIEQENDNGLFEDQKTTINEEKKVRSIEEDKKYVMNNLNILKSNDINSLFLRNNHPYFKKTRHTLLMFRRIGDKNVKLELRHQRTSDVVFEIADNSDPQKLDIMMKEYVYQMIETLLPKAIYNSSTDKHIKMMELFSNPEHIRPGWISVVEK